MNQATQRIIFNNLVWFSAAFILAVLVWFVAKVEANPVAQAAFRVPVQILTDDGMIITNNPRSNIQVFVEAQTNVLNLLDEEDIVVTADLREHQPGSYTIPLDVAISRPARADTIPAQLNVTIEQLVTRQKPVELSMVAPSENFSTQDLTQSIVQAEVSGSLEEVSSVVALRADLDLSDERAEGTISRTISLIPVNVSGNVVSDVTVNPRTVSVTVNIAQRDDVRELNVRPFILFNTLPEGYEFDNLNDWEPRTVLISGSPEDLEQLGSTIDTVPISLEGRTDDFVTEVRLDLPEGNYLPLSGSAVTVDIAIREEATTISLENVAVNIIGVPTGYTAQASPQMISVVLNGPQSLLDDLTTVDVQAVVDMNGVAPGVSDIVPRISIRQGQVNIEDVNITLLPSRVSVTLIAPTPPVTSDAAEATETPSEP